MRSAKVLAYRVPDGKNGYIVVVPHDFRIASGEFVESVAGRVVSAVALGPQ